MGWLLVLGLKEGLIECATLCVKIKVILEATSRYMSPSYNSKKSIGLCFVSSLKVYSWI